MIWKFKYMEMVWNWFNLYFDKDMVWNDILFWSKVLFLKVITTGYNNDWLAKRLGSDMDILSVDTENHFDNRVRGGDSRMK